MRCIRSRRSQASCAGWQCPVSTKRTAPVQRTARSALSRESQALWRASLLRGHRCPGPMAGKSWDRPTVGDAIAGTITSNTTSPNDSWCGNSVVMPDAVCKPSISNRTWPWSRRRCRRAVPTGSKRRPGSRPSAACSNASMVARWSGEHHWISERLDLGTRAPLNRRLQDYRQTREGRQGAKVRNRPLHLHHFSSRPLYGRRKRSAARSAKRRPRSVRRKRSAAIKPKPSRSSAAMSSAHSFRRSNPVTR